MSGRLEARREQRLQGSADVRRELPEQLRFPGPLRRIQGPLRQVLRRALALPAGEALAVLQPAFPPFVRLCESARSALRVACGPLPFRA